MQLTAAAAGVDGPFGLGDVVPLTFTESTDAGEAVAPAEPVVLELVDPEGITTMPALELDPDGLSVLADVEVAIAGDWLARWTSPSGVAEFAFVVTDEPALPYAATVEGARARVLNVARPTGVAPAGGAAAAPRVPDARVTEWLLEGGARVARKLRAIDELGSSEADPLRGEYRLAARGLTELYAAALLWDATYPQAAKDGEGRYGAVLFARFEKGLAELAADLAVDVAGQPDPGDPDPGDVTSEIGGAGAAARFPVRDPRIGRWASW